MGILIKEFLESSVMRKSKVLSGQNGINKDINRISVYDCPVREDVLDRKILKRGDLLITSLFFQKSSAKLLNEFIEMLNSAGCSGICVSNQYLNHLPEEVLKFSNEILFPIIQFDFTISYADIIETIMELIITRQTYLINELRIERLLKEKLLPSEVREIAFEINSNFKKNNCIIYIDNYILKDKYVSSKYLLDFVNFNVNYSAFYYGKSIIMIATFNCDSEKVIKSMMNLIVEEIDKYFKEYKVGISDFHSSITEINQAISESIFASKNSNFFGENISNYNDIGINRLLIPLLGNIEMEKFYSMIIEPIINYEKQINKELLKTVLSFVNNDGNYKKTAKELYQHENTIRYRINTVKSILNMQHSDMKFYESISIAIKIGNLLKK